MDIDKTIRILTDWERDDLERDTKYHEWYDKMQRQIKAKSERKR